MSKRKLWSSWVTCIGALAVFGSLVSTAFLLRGAPQAVRGTPNVMRIRVGGAVQATKLIRSVPPEYPPLARQARVQGTVQLEVLITTEGKVVQARLLSGPAMLVSAAINAVKQWQYSPTLLNGKPVEVVTTVDVNFYGDFAEVAKLLSRDTWAFTDNEIALVNQAPKEGMEPYIKAVIEQIPGEAWSGGVLMQFKVVDLDHDGIAEIITRIDWSGRGKALDLEILSRLGGKYDFGTVEYGSMNFVGLGNETLVVGYPPAFQLAQADPAFYYPVLYAWRDHHVVDVSFERRDYYLEHFVPMVEDVTKQAEGKRATSNAWEERTLLIRTIGVAKAINKVNSYFKEPVIGTDLKTRVDNYLARYNDREVERLDRGWKKALVEGLDEARKAMKR